MRILIATNHSYMFYRFRKELVEALMQEHEAILSTPFVGHEDDLQAMGLRCIDTEIDRRSINPLKDMKLLKTYRKMLDEIQPDLVITYSIKPNIYMGSACKAKGIPYVTNVQGLGTAFEKPVLSSVVSMMYRSALRKAETVFFENEENAQFFLHKTIISAQQMKVLPGAGINLDEYPYVPMKDDGVCSFLFVGRIMKEKGVDEFFAAAKTIKAEFGEKVAFDVVGFYEDAYKETVDQLVAESSSSTASRRTCIRSTRQRTVLCCPPTMRACPTFCWRVPPRAALSSPAISPAAARRWRTVSADICAQRRTRTR